MGLHQVLDRVRQLAAAPVFQTVDGAVAVLDQRLVALDHGRDLLALVRVDHEHDFVMTTHVFFYLSDVALRPDSPPPLIPRWGKGSRQGGRKPRIMAQMEWPGNRWAT
ncbi:hypothetical protein SMG44B_10601 [Stenotrophomonas maltophilia]